MVATHGVAMTLWLSTVGVTDARAFWSELRLPDVFSVNLLTHSVVRIMSTLLYQVR